MTLEQQIAEWYANARRHAQDLGTSWWRRAAWYALGVLLVVVVIFVLWKQRERRIYLENQLEIVKRREVATRFEGVIEENKQRADQLDAQADKAAAKAKKIEEQIEATKRTHKDIADRIRDVADWESLREEYDNL